MKKKSLIGYLIIPILLGLVFLLSDNSRFQQNYLRPALTKALQQDFGSVDIDSLRWHWGNASLELYDVIYRDSSGQILADAKQLDADFRILPLLWRQLHVQALRVDALCLHLDSDFTLPKLNKKKDSDKALRIKIDHVLVTASSAYDLKQLDIRDFQAKFSFSTSQDVQRLSIDDMSFVNAADGFTLSRLQWQASLEKDSILRIPHFDLRLPSSYITTDSIEIHAAALRPDSITWMKSFQVNMQVSSEDIPYVATAFHSATLAPISMQLQALASGNAQDIYLDAFKLSSDQGLVEMDGSIRLLNADSQAQWQTSWNELAVNPSLIDYYCALFPQQTLSLPENLMTNLGKTSFYGDADIQQDTVNVKGRFSTRPGDIDLDLHLQKNAADFYDGYAHIDLPSYQLDALLDNDDFQGKTSLNVKADLASLGSSNARVNAKAKIRQFPFKQYNYQHIDMQARAHMRGWYQLQIDAKDPECYFDANFQVDRRKASSEWMAQVDAAHINLQAMNLLEGEDENAHLSFHMDAHLQGDTIERLWGNIQFDSIDFYHHQTTYQLPSLLLSNHQESNRYAHLQLISNQINADIYGDMSWRQFYQDLQAKVLAVYLPSVFHADKTESDFHISNQFAFRVDVASTDSLAKAFSWPVSLIDTAHIEGYYYDEKDVFALSIMADSLRLQDKLLHQTHVMLDNKAFQTMDFAMTTHFPTANDDFRIDLEAKAKSDSLDMNIQAQLANNQDFASSSSQHVFGRDSLDALYCLSKLYVPYIQWKNAAWQLDTTRIDYHQQYWYIQDFAFHNEDQYFLMDGYVSDQSDDSLYLKVSQLNLAHIMQLFPPKKKLPKPLSFGGIISADASLRALLAKPEIDADVKVDKFSLNQSVIGNLDAIARWDHEASSLNIVSQVSQGDMHTGMVEGFFAPMKDSLYLNIDSEGLPLNFLSYYLEPMINLSAHAYGNVQVSVAPKRMLADVVADAYVPDGELYSPLTNTRYNFADSIQLTPGVMHFNQIDLYDTYNNHALFNGVIRHRNFMQMNFDLSMDLQNFHLMDLPMSDEAFYGEIEASGKARMSGNDKDIRIDLDLQTEDHTDFYLSLANNAGDSNYSFIEFVDKNQASSQATIQQSIRLDNQFNMEALPSNLSIDLNLDITPTANLIFVTNPAAGDEMRMSGNGTLRLSYDTKDDVQLFGRYELDKGKYGFTFQDLIHRDFNILQGSSINFSGDLMSANLDINANYSVLNVELSDILDEADLASMNLNRTSIPVNCQLSILGELQQPEIVLGLDFPSADEELRRRIMNIINTDEILNRQIVSLLLLNRFAMTENVQNSEAATNNNMSAVMDIGLNSLSNQLNRMIYQVMGSDNLSFDLNYRYDDMAEGLGEWQVAMSSQLLNNRLVINGNIGSREDLVNDNTQFIGDFDAEYKFSRDGRLRGKFFNRTNDSRYFKSAMTTQGVGVVYKESFHSFSELKHKITQWIARRIKRSKAESDISK